MCAQDSPPARGQPYSMPLDMDLLLPCGLPYPEPLSCCDILASPPPRPVSARQAADERPPPEPPPAAWVIKALAPIAAAVHARPPPVASAVSAATAAAAAAIATHAIDTLAAAPIPHLPPPMQPWALTHAQWNALMHALWGNTPRPPPPHGFGPCPYRASAESASPSLASSATPLAATATALLRLGPDTDTVFPVPAPHPPPPVRPWAFTHRQWNALMHALWGNTTPCPGEVERAAAARVALAKEVWRLEVEQAPHTAYMLGISEREVRAAARRKWELASGESQEERAERRRVALQL